MPVLFPPCVCATRDYEWELVYCLNDSIAMNIFKYLARVLPLIRATKQTLETPSISDTLKH